MAQATEKATTAQKAAKAKKAASKKAKKARKAAVKEDAGEDGQVPSEESMFSEASGGEDGDVWDPLA